MRDSEWIAVIYFVYLALAAAARPVARASRLRVMVCSIGIVAVAACSPLLPPGARLVRDVLPLAYILAGYWLPARLTGPPRGERAGSSGSSFEQWLIGSDAWIERVAHVERRMARAPRLVLEALELAYFISYVLVPLGLAAVVLGGAIEAADRYWSVALIAHLSAFGALPWLDSRPPWALAPSPLDDRPILMRRVNLLVVNHGSNRRNTFPSGHAAGAVAIAAFMLATVPATGPAFVAIAIGICLGAYVGRYHYAADVVAGVITGWLSWVVVRWTGL